MIVLLLNDHVLKQAWPGFVTGKLSDVAGLVVAPPLVALLLLRRADLAATILTGGLFAVIKTTETGAEVASLAWSTLAGPSRVLADPGGLLALPALALAWWVRQRSREQAPTRRRVLTAVPREQAPTRWRVLTAVPLAVLAVTATAAETDPPLPLGSRAVLVDDAIVVDGLYASEDGGRTWRDALPQELDQRAGQRAACLREHCYRLAEDRVRVLHSADGGRTWSVDWEITPRDVEKLEDLRRDGSDLPIAATSLVVQERPGGHVVVVTNRHDGIAVRDTDGTWRRLGLTRGAPPAEPATIPLDQPADDSGEMRVAGLLAAWTTVAALAAQAGRPRTRSRPASPAPGRRPRGSWPWLVGMAGLAALLLAPIPYERFLDDWLLLMAFSLLTKPAGIVLALCVVILATGVVRDGRITSRDVGYALGLGVAAGLCVATPFRAWSAGWLDYGVALTLAATAAPVTVAAGLAAIRYLTGSSTSSPT
ncbi:hypothetical protein AB0J42_14070 [Nonomuraea sp. NPDC049649]|uniref:hypothetical protein n=1 Tax=Nonomuraea sp. NPDC049649 TaxID=3155776 RepID=UPI003449C522